ncbi:AbiH family protein [Flavobacterium sp. 245]|uniref:AbiH family protein n=1 Tax=Flavobacterium sp. 245 TaxID=2512115 RepID=UPI00105E72B9|nr:AbiH family protein [Flavobacterium sp. 245]TDP04071.1 abortive infection AbiH-like protein [Flavobacterium sp. 245]
MNRLILIGNGFDLAHGLKTSYYHFISDYISRAINNLYINNSHEDLLLSLDYRYGANIYNNIEPHITPDVALRQFALLQKSSDYYTVKIKSSFLRETINKINTLNWVDLENDYFERLINCKGQFVFDIKKVNKINEEFDFLKKELESYLLDIQSKGNVNYSEELTKLFYEEIKYSDIVTCKLNSDIIPNKILFVSFNYTNTIEKYLTFFNMAQQVDVNYIHGKLDLSENPIVFGFGDEYNKSYLEFEEIKSNELLTHIKSFGYFNASNYHDLIKFIEDDHFQVYSFGHSLGLSDRTMLREIFENENCKSIKIFYHSDRKDYVSKTYDISKHFTNKGLMRKKIVPFTKSSAMPQPKEK